MEKAEIKEKILSKVIIDNKTHCWIWGGSFDKDGYGRIHISRHQPEERAHRVSYKIFKGKIRKGLWVLHTCDNTSCVNPEHLWLGNCLDNHRDMDKKNRRVSVKHEKHGNAKINKKIAMQMRSMYPNNNHREIALIFNVSRELVGQVVRHQIWKF